MKITEHKVKGSGVLSDTTFILDITSEGRYWRTSALLSLELLGNGGSLILESEKEADEYEILITAADVLKDAGEIITFNGISFDLPFLHHKYAAYGEADPITGRHVRDLYLEYRKLAAVLGLPSRRLKDYASMVSGGENASDDAERTLAILSFDAVTSLLSGNFGISCVSTDEIKDAVVFHLHIDPPFDGSFSVHDGIYHLTVKGNQAALCAHQRDGMLRMYHDDIANYYYLPIEGYAVHKSIAESVDKTRKEKAVRENCFHLISCSDQFLNQKTSCEQYVRSALRFLYSR